MQQTGKWITRGFEAFSQGTCTNAGRNLYVSRAGVLQRIHQYDLNKDGYVDLVFCNSQNHCEKPPVYVVRDPLGASIRVELPSDGVRSGAVADLNGDGCDDLCGDFARRLCLLAHERCAVFAGGRKVNHMNMWPYGCDGYLSTFMSFKPDIARRYWEAIEAKNLKTARTIIRDYDIPFFEFIATLTGGWNAGLHGTLEVFGIAKRWRRKPYHSLDDAEMEKLTEFLRGKGMLS